MTNFERIKSMTIEEMVDFTKKRCKCSCCIFHDDCKNNLCDTNSICTHGMEHWFNQEAEE